MRNLIIRLFINAVALAAAAGIVDGIWYADLIDLLIVAAVFGIVNTIIKPILRLLTCPLIIVTLGLFTFVLNGLLLWLTDWMAGRLFDVAFHVDGFWAAFWGALIISIVSVVLNLFLGDD